jgi:hypothetical protein
MLTKNNTDIEESVAKNLLTKFESHFSSPLVFASSFLMANEEDDTNAVDSQDQEAEGRDGDMTDNANATTNSTLLEEMKQDVSKGAAMWLDTLHGVYSGKFLSCLQTLAATSRSLPAVLGMKESEDQQEKNMPLSIAIRETKRLLNTMRRGLATELIVPNQIVGKMELADAAGGTEADMAEIAAERERIWVKAVAARKKFATLSVPRAYTRDGIMACFKNCGQVYKTNCGTRLFVASADLFSESAGEPWAEGSTPDATTWQEVLKFMKEMNAASDIACVFDGRMRTVRRAHEDAFQDAQEVVVLYKPDEKTRVGRTRRVAFSSQDVEMCHLTFAQSKTKLKLQKRELFNCLGETSTHCCSYSGVPVRPTSELPMIAANDKLKLLGISKSLPEVPVKWSAKHGAVIPAFWWESKPISFWRALLQDVGATHVFDLTSGSGALLEASLANGIHYHGLCSGPR